MLKKISLIAFIYSLQFSQTFSQTWQWATTAGGINSDKATDLDIDTAGNIYVCGYYNEAASFGTLNAPSTFGKDGYVAKLDTAGNWIWLQTAMGGYDERVLGLCVDKVHGFIYVTGCTWAWSPNDALTLGSCNTFNNPGQSDEIFVGKFDLNGNCQWLIGAGSDGDDHGYDLVTDKQGNIYLTGFISDHYGWFGNPATFGSITVPMPFGVDSSSFIAKISPSGVFLWAQAFPGTDGERDNRIAIDSLNNIYITGGFSGMEIFGPDTLTSAGERDVFVIKYDSNGNFTFAKRAGGLLDDRGNSITVDNFGDVYITGEFRDKAGFGSDSINNNGGANGRDIFVAKMKQDGNWIWAKKAGSDNGGERGDRIISNKLGNLFVTGQFMGTASFGPNITLAADSTDSLQVFVASIDTTGKWQWALQCGGTYEDRGNGLACDDSCNLFNAGYYKLNSIIGNDSLTGMGAKDIFVAKIINSCFNLPLPVAGFTVSIFEICQGECISFMDTSIGSTQGISWSFQGGNPTTSVNQNQSVCFSAAGTFNIQLAASNNYGTDTAFATILVNPMPATNAGNDTCIIAGSSIFLTATGGNPYFWNTGDTASTILVTPVFTTNYNVVSFLGLCSWGDQVTVKVSYPAEISGDTIICTGEEVTLTSSFGDSYLWSNGETTKSILVDPLSDTVFSVTITDACDTQYATSAINVGQLPQAFAGNDTTITLGTNAYLSASGGNSYLWNTGETTGSITVAPESVTVYSVTATNTFGCASADSVRVNVDISNSATLPSIFSPNGDGFNDKLFVRGNGIKEMVFTIFNRWGEKVFETNDINEGWDGTVKGKPADPSVFVYTLKGKYLNDSEIKMKGNVTLIR